MVYSSWRKHTAMLQYAVAKKCHRFGQGVSPVSVTHRLVQCYITSVPDGTYVSNVYYYSLGLM